MCAPSLGRRQPRSDGAPGLSRVPGRKPHDACWTAAWARDARVICSTVDILSSPDSAPVGKLSRPQDSSCPLPGTVIPGIVQRRRSRCPTAQGGFSSQSVSLGKQDRRGFSGRISRNAGRISREYLKGLRNTGRIRGQPCQLGIDDQTGTEPSQWTRATTAS